MKAHFLFLPALAVSIVACQQKPEPPQEPPATPVENLMSDEERIKKGEHLVMSIGCADCHAPKNMTAKGPEPNMELWLSGHPENSKLPPPQPAAVKAGWYLMSPDITAFVGPWGTSFAANLTPDTVTGIGAWTPEIFITAIREGKYHGVVAGRDMLPPMPWQFYRNLTDEELRSIFAYLKSIKPIRNQVPAPVPPAG